MDFEPPQSASQQERQKETLDDNARKFVVKAIDPEFLKENGASSFATGIWAISCVP